MLFFEPLIIKVLYLLLAFDGVLTTSALFWRLALLRKVFIPQPSLPTDQPSFARQRKLSLGQSLKMNLSIVPPNRLPLFGSTASTYFCFLCLTAMVSCARLFSFDSLKIARDYL